MNFLDQLRHARLAHQSLLCVGLDPEPGRFPAHMQGRKDKTFEFCADIVQACADVVLASTGIKCTSFTCIVNDQ